MELTSSWVPCPEPQRELCFFLKNSFRVTAESSGWFREFPYIPCPLTPANPQPPPRSTSPTRVVHVLQSVNPRSHTPTPSPLLVSNILCVPGNDTVPPLWCPKSPLFPASSSPYPPPTPGNHGSFYRLHHFAFPRTSYG